MSEPRTFAILYGMAEGDFQSRHLRRALATAGLQPVSPEKADIIIAHSGGSFLIPKDTSAKLFIHINALYWSTRPLPESLREKLIYEFRIYQQKGQLHHWAAWLGANLYYMTNLRHGLSLRKPYYSPEDAITQLPDSQQNKHVFIRNQHDSYSEGIQIAKQADHSYTLMSLPGHHDDCWHNPEPYVDIISCTIRG
jgi:hypothetical protein